MKVFISVASVGRLRLAGVGGEVNGGVEEKGAKESDERAQMVSWGAMLLRVIGIHNSTVAAGSRGGGVEEEADDAKKALD